MGGLVLVSVLAVLVCPGVSQQAGLAHLCQWDWSGGEAGHVGL